MQSNSTIANVISLCPLCGTESEGRYAFEGNKVFLNIDCQNHGVTCEQVDSDPVLFKALYSLKYSKRVRHLAIPVTYRCNLSCKYCYTLSNSKILLVPDRSKNDIVNIVSAYPGNVTFIGGEPTVRGDIFDILHEGKSAMGERKLSVATNGVKLADYNFARALKDTGVDFVFFSFNDPEYDGAGELADIKLDAMENLRRLNMPVWLQRTVDSEEQVLSFEPIIREFKHNVFNVTLRTVSCYGMFYPRQRMYRADLLRITGNTGNYRPGTSPFNCFVKMGGVQTKVASWVNDMTRLDPIDSDYIISDGTITTFHRGMKLDELRFPGMSAV